MKKMSHLILILGLASLSELVFATETSSAKTVVKKITKVKKVEETKPDGTKTEEIKKEETKTTTTTIEKTQEVLKTTSDKISATLGQTTEKRASSSYYILGSYAPVDLIVPGKYGLTVGYVENVDKTWELEYLRGTLSIPFLIDDLGEMKDQRFSVIARSYFGKNSFNLSYGLSYFDYTIKLGNSIMSRVTNNAVPSLDLVEINAVGLNIGIGNRWSFSNNITFGVDWISWSQPILVTKKQNAFLDYATNEDDRNSVKKAVDIITHFPRLSAFKLQFGWIF